MKTIFSNFTFLLLTASVALTTACSSGDDGTAVSTTTFSGNTAPAAIDATNAEAIGVSAGEAVQVANASNSVPSAVTFGSTVDINHLNALVLASINQINLPSGIDVSEFVCSSGTANVSDATATSGPVETVIIYNNCVFIDDNNITVSGTATILNNDIADFNAGFTLTYTNFTVTDAANGTTTTLNMTITCTNATSCTYSSDFVGSDGGTHRVTDFSLIGDATSGFTGSATFFNSIHGEVSITFTGITYGGSCGITPNGGNISFDSSNGSSGTIIFNPDCSVTGTWTSGSGSGSF